MTNLRHDRHKERARKRKPRRTLLRTDDTDRGRLVRPNGLKLVDLTGMEGMERKLTESLTMPAGPNPDVRRTLNRRERRERGMYPSRLQRRRPTAQRAHTAADLRKDGRRGAPAPFTAAWERERARAEAKAATR